MVLNTAALLSRMAHTNPPAGRARLYVMHGSVIPVVKAFGSNPRLSQILDDIPFDGAFGFCHILADDASVTGGLIPV